MKEAIVFVPGNDSKNKGEKLSSLVQDIKKYNSIGVLKISEDTDLYGHTGQRINVGYDDGYSRDIDIYEAYWGDLRKEFETIKTYQRPIKGFNTLAYWFHPKVWKYTLADSSKYLATFITTALLILWYLTIIATFLAFVKELDLKTSWDALDEIVATILEKLPSFNILFITSAVGSVFNISALSNISFNAMRYLKNDDVRNAMRRRVHDIVYDIAHNGKEYDKLTILSHSFGSAIGAHFVAECSLDLSKYEKFRFITMGAALSFLSHRSNWMTDIMNKCFKSTQIDEWYDYYSNDDWICSSVKIDDQENEYRKGKNQVQANLQSTDLAFGKNWWERILEVEKIHTMYSKNSQVVNQILSRT